MHSLSVCRTCPRHRSEKGGLPERVRALAEAGALPAGFDILTVECLGGCQQPSAAAFDAPDKWRIRLTQLAAEDAGDLMLAAHAYAGLPDGALTDEILPPRLRGRISARSPKRPGRSTAGGANDHSTLPRFEGFSRRT
jgi:predicted metal-binding protein